MGPDFKKFVIYLMSQEAIPAGGSFGDGIDFLLDPEKVRASAQRCEGKANEICRAVINCPDNPYGDDKNKIAAELLRRIKETKHG